MQLSLLDDRSRVVLSPQVENLDRVASRLQGAIIEFCDLYCGRTFHADQLRKYVTTKVGVTAPGSADRVLRDLRQRGLIDYEVVNRAKSLYRCGA